MRSAFLSLIHIFMLEDGTGDIFIPGRFTRGAMPGDKVLVEKFAHPRVEGSDCLLYTSSKGHWPFEAPTEPTGETSSLKGVKGERLAR